MCLSAVQALLLGTEGSFMAAVDSSKAVHGIEFVDVAESVSYCQRRRGSATCRPTERQRRDYYCGM